jgi:hypothetical protein
MKKMKNHLIINGLSIFDVLTNKSALIDNQLNTIINEV